MSVKGQQVLLINEFNEETRFYKWLDIESNIREIAAKYSNSYQLAFMDCSREIYSIMKHKGWKKESQSLTYNFVF